MSASILFLIPARRGSKGFPGKNVALLGGIPLVGRAARLGVRAAQAIEHHSRVICSTDDPAIAEIARAWGAEAPFIRPAALATDEASSIDVAVHAVDAIGGEITTVVLVQPTSPLTDVGDVLTALALFRETGGPVLTVCRAEHPSEWHVRMDDDGRLTRISPASDAPGHQRAEIAYRANGAVFVASPGQLRNGGFWSGAPRGFVMPAERSVTVTVPADLDVARARLAAQPVSAIEIAGRTIGPGHPCFVIAEAGVNHNGSLEMARALVDAAAAAGVDAVKFQTFKAEKVISRSAPKADYQRKNTGEDGSQLDMVKRLELSDEEHRLIFSHCRERGVLYLSSPFDDDSVNLLESMGVAAFKIGSGELTNHAFLANVARRGRPVLLSTGMADLTEIRDAVDVLHANGDPPVAVFHCVSSYPAPPEECNLAAMESLRSELHVPIGWSDHTLGTHVSVAAVARGANLVEKHFTLDRDLPGPDHVASLDPSGLSELVRTIRDVEAAIGTEVKQRQACEVNTADVARRSVHAARDIPAGQVIGEQDIVLLRPGGGFPANERSRVLGRKAARRILSGVLLKPEDIE